MAVGICVGWRPKIMRVIKSTVNYLGNGLLRGVITCFDLCNFLGKLTLTFSKFITGRLKLDWALFNSQLFEASCKLIFPLTALTLLITIGMILFAGPIVSQFNLQQHVVRITNNVLLRDTLPVLIALTLAFHFSIRLIHFATSKYKDNLDYGVHQHLLSQMMAISVAGPLLYLYIVLVNFIVIFLLLSVQYNILLPVYVSTLRDNIKLGFFVVAFIKIFISTIITGLAASFYYSQFNQKRISLYRAVSCLMTRVVFWLIISNILLVTLLMKMGY